MATKTELKPLAQDPLRESVLELATMCRMLALLTRKVSGNMPVCDDVNDAIERRARAIESRLTNHGEE